MLFTGGICLAADAPENSWPEATQTRNPGHDGGGRAARWNARELTRELETFAAAGIGGVEITPIYGARGCGRPDHRVPVAALGGDAGSHVTREARPARSGRGHGHRHRLAVRRSRGECGARIELNGAGRRTAGRKADGHEGQARGSGRRGPGAGSLRARCAGCLSRPLHSLARVRAARCGAQSVP